MKKREFFYVERFNIVDKKVDGFYVTTASSLDELLLRLENDDDFAGNTPYLPQVYGITEEQYTAFPYMTPRHEQALVTF